MKSYEFAHVVLYKILNDSLSFNLAIILASKDKKLLPDEKRLGLTLAGSTLRHFLSLDFVATKKLNIKDLDLRINSLLYLDNKFFVKKLDDNCILDYIKSSVERHEIDANFDEIKAQLEAVDTLIPTDFEQTNSYYQALRFNCPKWIVDMWRKHFGENVTYKQLKANTKPSSSFVSFYYDSSDLSTNNDFEKTDYDNVYKYVGKEALRKSHELIENYCFAYKPVFEHCFKEVDLDPLRGTALYLEYMSPVVLRLSKLLNGSSFDCICGNNPTFNKVNAELEKFKIDTSKVQRYEAKASSIITCISKPVHTFIVMPQSSNLTLLKNDPDYFLKFKQDQLDSIIESELLSLVEASNLVEENGQLIYIIETMNKKESLNVINTFLNEHKDFTLLKHHQYFSFERDESTLYYAILVKKSGTN